MEVSTGYVSTADAMKFAAELETALGEIAMGQRKANRLPMEPIGQLIQFARDVHAREQVNQVEAQRIADLIRTRNAHPVLCRFAFMAMTHDDDFVCPVDGAIVGDGSLIAQIEKMRAKCVRECLVDVRAPLAVEWRWDEEPVALAPAELVVTPQGLRIVASVAPESLGKDVDPYTVESNPSYSFQYFYAALSCNHSVYVSLDRNAPDPQFEHEDLDEHDLPTQKMSG